LGHRRPAFLPLREMKLFEVEPRLLLRSLGID
jgi:hypothetical protein